MSSPHVVTDMTDAEQAVMAEHTEYWKGLLADGVAVCFGAVLDPAGPYGLAVVEVVDHAQIERIAADDPAVRAGLTAEAHPMPGGFVRA
ncbi:YciI family protein [Cryptosporangium arvum]|uniref:YciI family protein n=1 Tax=Cryptosporangium arvum TaxID=80871 RepID=UPI0004B2A3BB|nr:YciI family protein [Cryptosporangium arvum]